MEKYYALINTNLVEAVIVIDSNNNEFISSLESQYNHVIDVTSNTPRPSYGDSYYSDTNTFVSNTTSVVYINDNNIQGHIEIDLSEGFEPFELSEYTVSYEAETDMIVIGCKKYSAPGFIDALNKVMIENEHTFDCFTSLDEGPAHGKFGITWDDAQLLYDNLIRDRL